MKVRRLILVGLVLSLLLSPITWAQDPSSDEGESFWGLDWLRTVVSWVQSIIEGPDPIPQDIDPFQLQSTTQLDTQTAQSGTTDRGGEIDPIGSK